MANKKILLTFIGGNDLNSENAPIEQILISRSQISEVHIFLTQEFANLFEEKCLLKKYKKISNAKFHIYKTGIENPTLQKEIYEKIKQNIDTIAYAININKDIGLINLSSGTPDIKAVWSVLMAIGELPSGRFLGIYAPNPKYDDKVRIDELEFYKNSYALNTIKLFIDKSNYLALSEFILMNKKQVNNIIEDDFINIVEFAKARSVCDFEKAENIYKEKKLEKYFEYELPKNLFKKAIENFYSAKIAFQNDDYFQATLKLAIIRENLLTFLNEKLLNGFERIADKYSEDKPFKLNLAKIRQNEPDLEKFLIMEQSKQKSNTEFDFAREINSHTEFLCFRYFAELKNNNRILSEIKKCFFKLEKLKSLRNDMAHTIVACKCNPVWLSEIEKILNLISEYFEIEMQEINCYETINRYLRAKLKISV